MRPVNLIPLDQRRGEHSELRTGPAMYIVLGALALLLLGVTTLVLAGNRISDSKAEVAELQREDAVVEAKANRLVAYSQFKVLSEQRVATVRSLADSRFDWERVMRELSLVLPADVWLTGLTASAAPGGAGATGGGDLRGSIPGPALELDGCAAGQEAVAGFVTALKDVDGVTRVGIEDSELANEGSEAGSGSDGGSDCRTRDFIAQFRLVVAFDAAPVSTTEGEEATGATAVAETTAESEGSEGSEEDSSEGAEGE